VIDFPARLLKKQLLSQLQRGKILRTQLHFQGVSRFKRLILLNKNFSSDYIYYVLSTSQVCFYLDNQNFPPIKGNFLYFREGQTYINQDEDMVIDCRRIDIITKGNLLKNYQNNILSILGDTPAHILREIDLIISKSKLIAQKIKSQVI
jgi:hypothetical protein